MITRTTGLGCFVSGVFFICMGVHAQGMDISAANSSDSTTGISNSVFLTSSVDERTKKPGVPIHTFSLDKKVFVYATLGDLPEKQPKKLNVRWFNCNKPVATDVINIKPAPNPNSVWASIPASVLRPGVASVDLFKESGELFSRTVFQVKNEEGKVLNCNGAEVQPTLPQKVQLSGRVITIPADATFPFAAYRVMEISPGGHEQLREIVRQLYTNAASINSIDIVGHTDNIGSFAANKELSERRAMSIATIFRANGFTQVRAAGASFSSPVVNCGNGKNPTPEVIACNAPNRRVEIKVSYLETSKPHQLVR